MSATSDDMSGTIVKYFIAETDVYEEPKHPNVVKFSNRGADEITLMILKKRLEVKKHNNTRKNIKTTSFDHDNVLTSITLNKKLHTLYTTINTRTPHFTILLFHFLT
jgi:hypothetical protein